MSVNTTAFVCPGCNAIPKQSHALTCSYFNHPLVNTDGTVEAKADMVNHPPHYKTMPNGIEVIDVTEHFDFNLGNALKYIMRAGHKTEDPTEDLNKAIWYIKRAILKGETYGF